MGEKSIKSFAITGHSSSGKTTLSESMLYSNGVITRQGEVEQGNTVFDFDPIEIKRKISINLSVASMEADKNLLYIIDTPGYMDFEGEVRSALWVADNAVLVVDAQTGVDVGTEKYYEIAASRGIPAFFVINKMGMSDIDVDNILVSMKEIFGSAITPVQSPVGIGEEFSGVKSLLHGAGKEAEAFKESIIELSEELLDKYMAGEEISDDELTKMLKYGIRERQIIPVLYSDAKSGRGVKELIEFLSAFGNSIEDGPGINGTLKGEEMNLKPDNSHNVLFVFKTLEETHLGKLYFVKVVSGEIKPGTELYNTNKEKIEKINQIYNPFGKERKEVSTLGAGSIGVLVKLKNTETQDTLASKDFPFIVSPISMPEPQVNIAVKPRTREDQEKVMDGLNRIKLEDLTFKFRYDSELRQTLIYGLGETHLDVAVEKLKNKFNVTVDTDKPKVPYRESIRKQAEGLGKFVKQSGGHGQYGICNIRIEPLSGDSDYEFVNDIFGGAIPNQFIPSVEQGVKKAMEQGVLAGAKVVNVKVTLYDGKYHPVDSSNFAFEVAGSMAFKEAEEKADPYLLEPIYTVEVKMPEKYMGDVMGDLNSRRGRIMGMEAEGRLQKIKALIPLAELYRYSSTLRSITKGRGSFRVEFSHYDEVPREIAPKLIEELKKEQKEAHQA